MTKKIIGLSSLMMLGLLQSAICFSQASVSQQEYAKFKTHDHDEINFDNGKHLPYTVISRSVKGNIEIVTAKIDDPLQADLLGYNNLIVTLDNDKKELQGFVEISDGRFQLDTKGPYPVWKKNAKPKVIDSLVKTPTTAKISERQILAANMPAPTAIGEEEKDAAGNYVIDVYMGFSDQAAAFINNNLKARAEMEIASVNTALKNSNIQGVYLRLVGVGTTPNNPGIIWEPIPVLDLVKDWFKDDIARLQPDLIAIQQVQTGAPNSAGGWAGIGGDTQVVDIDLPGAWVHEVGHNIGGIHCKNDDPDNTGYNYGYSVREGRGTVMCGNEILYYSSPLIRDDEGNILGSATDADMARVWRERMAEVAANRIHTVPYSASSSSKNSSSINSSKSSVISKSSSSQRSVISSSASSKSSVSSNSTSSKSSVISNSSSKNSSSSSGNSNSGTPTVIQNYWLEDQSLNIEHGKLESSNVSPSLLSDQWIFERVTGTSYFRIKNRLVQTQFLNIENGALVSTAADDGWWSAQWVIEPVANTTDLFRLKNRWKPNQYINVENNVLKAGAIRKGWWSAMWKLTAVK